MTSLAFAKAKVCAVEQPQQASPPSAGQSVAPTPTVAIATSCPEVPVPTRISPADTTVAGFHGYLTNVATLHTREMQYTAIGGAPRPYGPGADPSNLNPNQGVILVLRSFLDPCAPGRPLAPGNESNRGSPVVSYPTPLADGVVTLDSIHGTRVDYHTSAGTTGSFDVITDVFGPAV